MCGGSVVARFLPRLEDVLQEHRDLAPVRVRWRGLSMPTEARNL